MKNLVLLSALIFVFNLSANAQTKSASASAQTIKSSAAYAELLLRKTELDSEVESLLETYTEDFPKLKESRYELDLLQKDLSKLLAQPDGAKLTSALGKLLVRRATVNADLWALQNRYGAEHAQVKRARRKAASFDNAVKEIMP